jgi:phage terminase large subunit
MLTSYHKDNPYYWSNKLNDWTAQGREYIQETLEALSGVRRLRLLLGLWAAAEGIIYEGWNPGLHHVRADSLPEVVRRHARRLWVVDFGYDPDPFVWQEWAIDGFSVPWLVREIYCTKRLIKDIARDILSLTVDSPRPEAIIADHDSNARATLESELQMGTVPAYKKWDDGHQAVCALLKPRPDGTAGLKIIQGCTYKPDERIRRAGRPNTTAKEFESYIWHPPKKGVTTKKGVPLDKDNHGMDALRYMAAYLAGFRSKGGAKLTTHENAYGDEEDDDRSRRDSYRGGY